MALVLESRGVMLSRLTSEANAAYFRDTGSLVKWCVHTAINDRKPIGRTVTLTEVKDLIRGMRYRLCGVCSLKELNESSRQMRKELEQLLVRKALGSRDMVLLRDEP